MGSNFHGGALYIDPKDGSIVLVVMSEMYEKVKQNIKIEVSTRL